MLRAPLRFAVAVLSGLLVWVPAATPAALHPRPSVAFSPDGTVLAVAGYREVALVEARSGKVRRTLSGHAGSVTGVAFNPGGTLLAATSGEPGRSGEIRLWELKSGQSTALPSLHTDVVYGCAWSPDGRTLAACGYDRLVSLWDAASRKSRILRDHTDAVYSVAFSPAGDRVASASGDRTVKVWDVATGKRLYTLGDSTAELYTLAFHPSGKLLTAAGVDKMLRTWTVGPAAGALSRSAFAHDGPVVRLAYTPDGTHLYTTSEDRSVKLWNGATLQEERVFERQPDWAIGLAAAPDGKSVAVSRYDGSVTVYDAATGARRLQPFSR